MSIMATRNWDDATAKVLAELKAAREAREERKPVSEGVKQAADRFNRTRGRYAKKAGGHYYTSSW